MIFDCIQDNIFLLLEDTIFKHCLTTAFAWKINHQLANEQKPDYLHFILLRLCKLALQEYCVTKIEHPTLHH